jgi:hypothetical protein
MEFPPGKDSFDVILNTEVYSCRLDLICTKESWERNKDVDYLINPSEMGELSPAVIYARGFISHSYGNSLY